MALMERVLGASNGGLRQFDFPDEKVERLVASGIWRLVEDKPAVKVEKPEEPKKEEAQKIEPVEVPKKRGRPKKKKD